MTVLEVNENTVDLTRTKFGLTLKRIDIGNLSTRYLSHTSGITIPLNENNDTIFGNVSDLNTVQEVGTLPAKLKVSGLEVVNGTIVPISADNKSIRTAIYDGMKTLADNIKNKKIRDCEPIPPSAWTSSAIDTARLNTSGIVSVVIDWGRSSIYNVNYFLPCFYYKTIVEKIFQFAGFTLQGDILTDPAYTGLVMPFFDKFEYRDQDIRQYSGKMTLTSSPNVTGLTTASTYKIPFDQHDSGEFINISSSQYDLPTIDYNIQLTVEFIVSVGSITWNDGNVLTLMVTRNTVPVSSQTVLNPAGGSGGLVLTSTVSYSSGDVIACEIASDAPTTGIDFTVSVSVFSVKPSKVPDRNLVKWQFLMNDVTMNSIITDFFTRFGLVAKQSADTITVKTLQKIIEDKHLSIDMTNGESDGIEFRNPFARVNKFLYSDSDTGMGTFEAVSQDEEKTVFTSIFKATEMVTFGYYVARIPVYDSTSSGIADTKEDPGVRLLYTKGKETWEPNITFHLVARSDFKIGYFVDEGQTFHCGFDFFLNRYYASFIEAVRNMRFIRRKYVIPTTVIANYDPHTLWYDNGYFLVNEIKDWIEGKKTNVDLIRIF